jgi:hypothetical protein
MATGSLINSGRSAAALLLFIFISLMSISSASAAGRAETELDRQRVHAGESAVITVKISDASGGLTPAALPEVPGLEISYQGMSQSVRIVNMNMWRGVELRFAVTPLKPGVYTVPAITITGPDGDYKSTPVTITASPAVAGSGSPGLTRIRAEVEVPVRSVYTGQPALMRYFLITGGEEIRVEGFDKAPQVKGFVLKKIDETLPDKIVRGAGGEYLKTHLGTFVIIPAVSGTLKIGGGSVSAVYQAAEGFFRSMRRMRVQCPELTLEVKPLPAAGKPAGYRGDVGAYKISIDREKLETAAGDEARINVTVKGEGNLYTLSDPLFAGEGPGFRVLKESSEPQITTNGGGITGEKKYVYTLIPSSEGDYSPGPLSIEYFDPALKKYVTASTPAVSLKALKGEGPADREPGSEENPAETPGISGNNSLYITAAVITTVALAAFILIYSERRRFRNLSQPAPDTAEPAHEKKKNTGASRKKPRAAALEELKLTRNAGDTTAFLKMADNILSETGSDPAFKNAELEISSLREKIHSLRYGGGAATAAEKTDDLYDRIAEVTDRMA